MRKHHIFKVILLTALLTLIFTGCKKEEVQPQPTPPAVVSLMTVEQKDVPFRAEYVGITEGSKAVEVRAQVGGILRQRHYQEGQYVNFGDVLFTIESDTYEAALKTAKGNLDMAKAQLRQAKLDYDRYLNLYKTNSISKKDYDAALAAYESAKAQVETAQGTLSDSKIRLGYTNVIAPVSGYTSKANFTEGNLISTTTTTPLTVINQVDPIYVNFSIPATTMTQLRLLANEGKVKAADNLTSTVFTADKTKYPEQGKVIFFDKMITASTGDIKIKAEFPNPVTALLPGQYVRATLDGFTLVNAIVIPQKAIVQRQGKQFVIVVENLQNGVGQPRFVPVDLGINMGNYFLVNSGLKAGDLIVTEGSNKVMSEKMSVMDSAVASKMMSNQQQQQQQQKAK